MTVRAYSVVNLFPIIMLTLLVVVYVMVNIKIPHMRRVLHERGQIKVNETDLRTEGIDDDENNEYSFSLSPVAADAVNYPRMRNKTMKFEVPECGCVKEILSSYDEPIGSISRLPQSACSDEATLFGPDQLVVSFSLFVKQDGSMEVNTSPKQLYEMAWINLHKVRKYYQPGFVVRLYTNVKLAPFDDLCRLSCENQDFFLCHIQKIPVLGDLRSMMYMTWRDLPLGDSTVSVFTVRDLDSYISTREAAVVKDWLENTDKAIHLMRDKMYSHYTNILGGMWGASNKRLGRPRAQQLQELLIRHSQMSQEEHHWGFSFDQGVLSKIIYSPNRESIVAYDSCHCVEYSRETLVRPFPTKRLGGWDVVGSPYGFPYDLEECPAECRPKYGRNWTYC